MPGTEQRPKVTVEDLLRLKRLERPAPEFWTRFESELRQKQLAALLEKRPWWQGLPRVLMRHAYLPVGATAAIAFTLVSVRYYAPTPVAQSSAPVERASAGMAPSSALPATAAVVPVQTVDRNEIAAAAPRETVIAAPIAESHAAEVTELMPLLIAPRETERPSSRLLTASLARLEQPEADFTAAALHAAVRSPAPATTDELASVPASVSRRNRLLAQYEGRQFNPDPAPPEVLRERLTRRLGEPETSERSSRMVRDNDSFARPMPQIVALRF